MNRIIKQQIAKMCQESNLYWYQAPPLALLRIRVKPKSKENLSPFEILHGRPYLYQYKGEDLNRRKQPTRICNSLRKTVEQIPQIVLSTRNRGLGQPIHSFK